jgi:uncharacterized protein
MQNESFYNSHFNVYIQIVMKKIFTGASLLCTMLISACSTTETKTPEPKPIGMANPASVYCDKIGGTSIVKKDSRGNEVGYCRLADGKIVEEWELFRSAHQENSK